MSRLDDMPDVRAKGVKPDNPLNKSRVKERKDSEVPPGYRDRTKVQRIYD